MLRLSWGERKKEEEDEGKAKLCKRVQGGERRRVVVASGSRLTSSLPPLSLSLSFVGSSDPHACLWTIQNTFRNWGSSSDNQVASSSEAGLGVPPKKSESDRLRKCRFSGGERRPGKGQRDFLAP